ncbi:MAG: hypothetical protein BGN84_17915 [Afipia sp. 62-7]|jgi:hypothetical protein|uniref:hypothetical protein n=1 Tax=Tardiphaga sp. TaxID=1926292 RepID=UPI00092973B1|nr:MAG: hypothetical protein BGN84_17915 [Afipia sp. 62-7]OYU88979.1 MAG: hypothetical protein CFE29_15655 [Bradyrhizobiaceae bacterium PARB1]
MSRKKLLVSAVLASAVSFSAAANAGSTITDKSYWPGEIRQQSQAVGSASPLQSFAYDGRSDGSAPKARAGAWTYNGGPKGR